jgi:DNA-binding transcriptional ArsR family regulator
MTRLVARKSGPVDCFRMLASPVRRRIIEVLALGEHDTGNVEAVIQFEFGIGRAAVQHHLALLRQDGTVVVHPEWQVRSLQRYGHAERLDPATGRATGGRLDLF